MADAAETLGERIRQVRGALSQADFASKIGVNKNLLGKYERGESVPGGEILRQMHEALGIDITWLLTGHGPTKGDEAALSASPARVEADEDLVGRVANAVDSLYREAGIRLPAADLARTVERFRVDIVNAGATSREGKMIALNTLLEAERRQLHSRPHPAPGKASA